MITQSSMACVAALSALVAAPAIATPTTFERFGPRHFVQAGGREVPVTARYDMFAVRTALEPAQLAHGLEEAIAKLADPAAAGGLALADVRSLRGGELVLVELVAPVSRPMLAALAERVADIHGVLHVHPALARMSGRAFADERLVVTAAPGRLDEVLAAAVGKTGGALLRRSPVPNTALIAVGAPFAFDAVAASSALQGLPGLVAAEPNLHRELALRATTFDDPLFAAQWHLSRRDDSIPGTGEIFADDAWEVTLGDPSVVVAVFDSGIDLSHPDLVDKLVPGFDAAGNDSDPSPGCSSRPDGRSQAPSCAPGAPYRESHGTAVAGIIGAASGNAIGTASVCPRCSILPVRLITDVTNDSLTVAEAFVRAVDAGADVINNSWGPGFSLYFPLSTAEREAFRVARTQGRDGKGTVILFAAGNDTSNVASDAYATHPDVIAVAASTNLDDWALYSNFGRAVDIAAPSQGLPASQDGVPDDDYGIVTSDVMGAEGYDASDTTDAFGGTSAACPVTAGVAGLVLAVNPALTAAQVRLVLTSTADKIVADKMPWRDLLGEDIAAIFAYDDTGHSIGFGFGRVNAARAVAKAARPGQLGAACGPACAACTEDGLCLTQCRRQADCPDGSTCNVRERRCELPTEVPGAFLSPCTSDCDFCTPTLDTEFRPAEICTVGCDITNDTCPDGFDCRLTEPGGPAICGVGDKGAGEPADFFQCYAPQLGTSLVVVTGEGRELCGDVCFGEGPGACPFGFSCQTADCTCTRETNWGCFEFTCSADPDRRIDADDFDFPVCMPDPGFGDVCASDLECQRGDYCKDGVCRLDDRGGCDICNTCASDDDCMGRGVCLGANDDGVGQCVWACGDTDPCPGDSVCRPVAARRGTIEVCLSPDGGTTEADRCDPSYACEVPCRDDVPCGAGEVCAAGRCERAPPAREPDPEDEELDDAPGCGTTPSAQLTWALAGLALWRTRARRRR